MIYYANRDPVQYLQNKPDLIDHSIISVAGGMGYIHFLNEHTQNLLVVDRDQQNLDYNQHICELIQNSSSLQEFCTTIRAQQQNSGIKIYYDCNTDVTQQLMSYHWYFGTNHPYSAFYDENSFVKMKRKITLARFILADLSKINYSHWQRNATYVYVSNADWNIYNKSDGILHQIISSMKMNSIIYYRSWYRSLTLRPGMHHIDAAAKLIPYTTNRSITEIKTHNGYTFKTGELHEKSKRILCFNEQPTQSGICDCLLYHISLDKSDDYELVIKSYFNDILGSYKRIIILDHSSNASEIQWIKYLKDINFHYSYQLCGIEWSGGKTSLDRNFIMIWDLRR
jgi:hypothetical protein